MLIKQVKTPKQDLYYEYNERLQKYERTTYAHGVYMISKENAELISTDTDKVKSKTTKVFKILW